IEELTQIDRAVLATGGGAIIRKSNRDALAQRGYVVYLHATIDEQVRRTRNDQNRPLLNQGDPREVLAELSKQREPLYREIADHVINTDRSNPKSIAQRLLGELR
ncbi:MAG: shikimate kinase, partial [Pseudomonadota bacterium]